MGKTLVVYHSLQGNTEYAAKTIAEHLDADTVRINGKQKTVNSAILSTPRVVTQMINRKGFNQVLENVQLDLYDQIVIASPCWFYDVTPPIKEIVKTIDFTNKSVYLLVTHGGDIGATEDKFKASLNAGSYKGMIELCGAKTVAEKVIKRKFKQI